MRWKAVRRITEPPFICVQVSEPASPSSPAQPASPLTAPAPAPFTTVSACLLAMMGWSRRRCFHLQVTVLTQTGC